MTPLPTATTTQALLHWAGQTPHRAAVLAGGQSYTWLGLATHVAQLRAALAAAGLRPGQIVALYCPNRYLNLLLVLAAEALGAIHASLASADLRPDHQAVAHAQLICTTEPAPTLAADPRLLRLDQPLLEASLSRPAELATLATPSAPEAGVRLGWTSGSTGTPKFMLNTRAQLSAIVAHAGTVARPLTPAQTCLAFYGLHMRPMYLRIIHALQKGNTVFMVSEESGDIAGAGPLELTHATLLAREAEMLARACAAAGRFLNLYYVDFIGSMLSPAMLALLRGTLSHHIFSGYASNETNVVAAVAPDGTARVARDCEVMIVDAAGEPVPPGQVGQIRVRGPRVIDGYLWDPALTARHFRDGWFLMSDLASMPEPGLLHLVGRADDMLNIGGEKLAPYPLEQALKQLPGVADALLLRRENAMAQGELVVLLECANPTEAAALRPQVEQLIRPVAETFQLFAATALPRTVTGKPRREEALRQLLAGELG
jgi:acyl-coenzyme A synthetase/AMP-(fatty) acid ligase